MRRPIIALLLLLHISEAMADDRITSILGQYQARLKVEKDSAVQARLQRDIDVLEKMQFPSTFGSNWIRTDPLIIEGTLELSADTIITTRKLVFRRGAAIATHGYALFIDATTVDAEGLVTVDGDGTIGRSGSAGPVRTDTWTSRGDSDYWAAIGQCRSQSNHPDRGSAGQQGGAGGPGSVVVLAAGIDAKLKVTVTGGAGGKGGSGGPGRELRNGRNFFCNGCTASCPSGSNGPEGRGGANGDVVVLQVGSPVIPPLLPFDGDFSSYRIYENPQVPKGKIRLSVENAHPNNGVVFEVWKDSSGKTFSLGVDGNRSSVNEFDVIYLERLVWVGHKTVPINMSLNASSGWSIDFYRKNK